MGGGTANVADIAYFGGGKIKTCSPDKWNSNKGTPIGVVFIPASHTPDEKMRILSLDAMNLYTPGRGSRSDHQHIYYGGKNIDTPLTNFTRVPYTNGSNGSYGYLPSDRFTYSSDPYYTLAKYFDDGSDHIPGLFNADGSRNAACDVTISGYNNMLTDFAGKANTDILCSLATAQSDWRTASTITNDSGSGYYPAACCCWRYYTTGTSQGDWYLPAIGELVYIMQYFNRLDDSIQLVSGLELPSYLMSSSELDNNHTCIVRTADGCVTNEYLGKGSSTYVRAVLSV